MDSQDSLLILLRHQVPNILLGTVFLFVGLAACVIAAIRRRAESRMLVWFGLFIGLYGVRMLAELAMVLGLAPGMAWPKILEIWVDYLLVIPALLFWTELSRGWFRRLLQILILAGLLIGVMGLSWYGAGGSPYTFLRYNSLLAISSMLVMGVLVAVPRLSKNNLLLRSGVLRVVMPGIALVAVYANVLWFFGMQPGQYVEPIAFVAWISALGYEAARHTFDNERRLVVIESELETARQIQSSILPDRVPAVDGLMMAATYSPMSAVAGDFYGFVQAGERHVGLLVADVTGHGVPAALIASMIKVAMQSVADVACDAGLVMSKLNRILTPELGGRLTSAAYLSVDAETHRACYSAAGHPALLHWKARTGELQRIESNGLLFGIDAECEYPSRIVQSECGDRFLLYTDGLTEPENSAGEAFGDFELERLIRKHPELDAAALSQQILSALRKWQPASASQQDDITLLTLDVGDVAQGLAVTDSRREDGARVFAD